MAQDNFVAPAIQPSGTTWAQFKTGGVGILLANLAAANPPKANPSTQATVSVSGSGGQLPAGTYYCRYSFADPFGETLAGGESAQFTVTAGQVPTVTVPALPVGVQAINLYLTQPGGAQGTETLYATGITTTTFACSYALAADQPTAALPGQEHDRLAFQWKPSGHPGQHRDRTRVVHRKAFGAAERLAHPAADGLPRHRPAAGSRVGLAPALDRSLHAHLDQLAHGDGRIHDLADRTAPVQVDAAVGVVGSEQQAVGSGSGPAPLATASSPLPTTAAHCPLTTGTPGT